MLTPLEISCYATLLVVAVVIFGMVKFTVIPKYISSHKSSFISLLISVFFTSLPIYGLFANWNAALVAASFVSIGPLWTTFIMQYFKDETRREAQARQELEDKKQAWHERCQIFTAFSRVLYWFRPSTRAGRANWYMEAYALELKIPEKQQNHVTSFSKQKDEAFQGMEVAQDSFRFLFKKDDVDYLEKLLSAAAELDGVALSLKNLDSVQKKKYAQKADWLFNQQKPLREMMKRYSPFYSDDTQGT